jgi:hypothetical protein
MDHWSKESATIPILQLNQEIFHPPLDAIQQIRDKKYKQGKGKADYDE